MPPSPSSIELMGVGALVLDSPRGPGNVERFGQDGLPVVNGGAVAWCLFKFGPSPRGFDPRGEAPEAYRRA